MACQPVRQEDVRNRPVGRPVTLGQSGQGAAPPVKEKRQTLGEDGGQGHKQRPVISSGDGAVEDIAQAGYHEQEDYGVNELDGEYGPGMHV